MHDATELLVSRINLLITLVYTNLRVKRLLCTFLKCSNALTLSHSHLLVFKYCKFKHTIWVRALNCTISVLVFTISSLI